MNRKQLARLKDGQIAKAGETPGFYARRRGTRVLWIMRYRIKGRQQEFCFGHLSEGSEVVAGRFKLQFDIDPFATEQTLLDKAHGPSAPLSPREAKVVARQLRSQIERGLDPAAEQRQRRTEAEAKADRTFEALAERWLKLHLSHKRSFKDTPGILQRHVYPRIGSKRIEEISRRDIHEIADALLAADKVAMAGRTVRVVKAVLNWCVERGELTVNPATRLKLARMPQSRERVLAEPELRAIWRAAGELGDPEAACVKVLALTLQRRQEVAGMRWEELDGARWTIPAERYKSGRSVEVPLPRQALELIEALPRRSEFVFAGRTGRPINGFSKLEERLDKLSGVSGWRYHDLRRSGATWLQENGVAPHVTDAVLGHSLQGILRVYARGDMRELKRAALQRWADWLSGEPVGQVVPLRQAAG